MPQYRNISTFNLKLMNFNFGNVLVEQKESNIPGFVNGKFGGRNFGGRWAGVEHTLPILFYVHKDVVNSYWVNVRISEKIVIQEDGTEKIYPTIWVRNPHTNEGLPEYFSYLTDEYKKDTIQGFFHRHKTAENIPTDVSVLCESITACRSRRFGNRTRIIFYPSQLEISYEIE